MKKVCILCRGKSLLDINYIPDDADLYITVNRFADELRDVNISNKLKNKKLHHMTSLSPEELDGMIIDECFIQYDYRKLVLPYLSETIPASVPTVKCRNSIVLKGKVLSDKCKSYMFKRGERPDGDTRYAYSFPTSGLATVCYAAVDLKADNIHIIGLDFYDGVAAEFGEDSNVYAYIGSDLDNDEIALRRGEDADMMKDFFTNFVKKFPEKTFSLYTNSSYNEDLDNLKVITLNEEDESKK